MVVEKEIGCAFCGEGQTLLLDLSAGDQNYIEDCQVCCQPMQIVFATDGEHVVRLDVERAD